MDQWNTVQNPELKPYIYGQLIFDNGTKNTQQRKNSLFNKWCCENWVNICRTIKFNRYITSLTKVNSKWIKYLNIRPDTIKLLEENSGKKFLGFVFGNNFLDMEPNQTTKAKINKWDYTKFKRLCTAKETI